MAGRPRARGGHPWSETHLVPFSESSPRSRGSSLLGAEVPDCPGVVPALAGVILDEYALAMAVSRRPRARGGHPSFMVLPVWLFESSPRSRGSSRAAVGVDGDEPVVPALAGVIPILSRAVNEVSGRPRARGGHPVCERVNRLCNASSPRSRGSSRTMTVIIPEPDVVPALAGVIRPGSSPNSPAPCRPRAGGGHPHASARPGDVMVSSPRSRGSSPNLRSGPGHRRVVPALAGVIRRPRDSPSSTGCRPRARGGHPGQIWYLGSAVESSPRSRGSSVSLATPTRVRVVVPALAGVILMVSPTAAQQGGRPRARGGHPTTSRG